MFINDFFKTGVTESKQAVSDYDTWRDQVSAAGGEIHPQRDRVHLVAQSWDGDTIGEFNLKTNQGWFGTQGVAEGEVVKGPWSGMNKPEPGERYVIIRTKPDGEKDFAAGTFDSWQRAKEELQKFLDHSLHTKFGHKFEIIKKQQGVAEGKGDFAQAIENLHGWYEEESSNPNIRVWEFDDREGGYYAQGTVYYDVTTGRVKIKFEDRDGYHGGDVNDTFNSIGDAMNVLKNITVQIKPNTGKAQNFDKLGGRTLAGPDDLYKTDREGRKGTLNKRRMGTMKASSPYRKTGPEGILPEQQGVAEGLGKSIKRAAQGWGGAQDKPADIVKRNKAHDTDTAKRLRAGMDDAPEHTPQGLQKRVLDRKLKGVTEGSDDGYGYKSLSTEQIMKLIQSGNWEAVQDVVPDKHIQLRNNRNGKSTTVHVKRDMAEGNELPPNVVDMIKKIAQSTAAPEHKKAMIDALIAKYRDSAMAETYGAELHTKHKRNRFKQLDKIKQTQKKAFGLDEAGCTMTKEGQECPMHGLQECPGYEMTETSPQDKLHQQHQEIRKKSGLPHPDHYLKMMKQKQAEIDALRADIAADKAKGLGEATVTPRIGGFQQTTDDDGTVTSDYSVGPVSASTTRRPNTINTTSATVPLAHNVQLTVDKGIGFGGAGKNVTPGGNQVSTITARTAQNPQGTTSSFVGQPTTQDLEKAIPKDWASSESEFSDDINEDIERYVEALTRAGYEVNEEKVRLDPKCWKGKKIGNPKTKMKGGVRVNNCVPK